jgi:hypothetical protein
VARKAKVKEAPKKKIKPYPFEGRITTPGGLKPFEVLMLSKDGVIARVNTLMLHVGDHYQIQFELPVLGRSVFTQVRIMKTYDKALDDRARKVERMAEFRFEKLSDDHKNYITSFLTAVGQLA